MGSNGSGTLRSSSASTGSGSSGSVVTVIAADDPNGAYRSKVFANTPGGSLDRRGAPGGGGGSTFAPGPNK